LGQTVTVENSLVVTRKSRETDRQKERLGRLFQGSMPVAPNVHIFK